MIIITVVVVVVVVVADITVVVVVGNSDLMRDVVDRSQHCNTHRGK